MAYRQQGDYLVFSPGWKPRTGVFMLFSWTLDAPMFGLDLCSPFSHDNIFLLSMLTNTLLTTHLISFRQLPTIPTLFCLCSFLTSSVSWWSHKHVFIMYSVMVGAPQLYYLRKSSALFRFSVIKVKSEQSKRPSALICSPSHSRHLDESPNYPINIG